MELSKLQSEFYCMELYRVIFNYREYEVIKFESPDFIIWKKNVEKVGIEATTPSNEDQNLLKNIANNGSREKLGDKYSYEKYKRDGKIYSDGVLIQSSSSRDIHDIILKGIEKKFIKLNKNYTLFNKNILCCTPISVFLNNEDDHNYFIEGLNKIKSKYKIIFDEVIVIMYDRVVRYSLNEERNYIFENDMDLSKELIREVIDLISKD
ncbi:hypothetical protein [Neobacillus massiliamazoniensis]|uniref:hypothetical protein n=1 Tax=Neobacillus massiliamazoniensis TaxID=1499688 RepID=UPI000B8204CA|nr:hypothetical protein [Neobacillus massiliamazoniensis]